MVLGGLQSANQIRKWVKAAQDKQKELVKEAYGRQAAKQQKQAAKIAVNEVFLKRLGTILSMWVYGWHWSHSTVAAPAMQFYSE